MTAAEKRDIFTFVKLASSGILGYTDRTLDESKLIFMDDIGTAAPDKRIPASGLSMQGIIEKISSCQNCRLCSSRTNSVPGEGVAHPVVLVVGEGPGEMEDKSGRPFVGPAGQLLDKMLAAINLSRTSNCYIANIVKCRPPKNRDPLPDESASCISYLEAQIHLLKPKIILAMGNIAAKKLLDTSNGISHLRGNFYDYKGIPLTATYHPSALLHNVDLKRPAWDDLKALRSWLEEHEPGYDEPFKGTQKQ
ncbi:MAG: uracil-DNA glycosylase [Treponema sp.]|nr:uracil-DNA glycosylase [Treponema sp.]